MSYWDLNHDPEKKEQAEKKFEIAYWDAVRDEEDEECDCGFCKEWAGNEDDEEDDE